MGTLVRQVMTARQAVESPLQRRRLRLTLESEHMTSTKFCGVSEKAMSIQRRYRSLCSVTLSVEGSLVPGVGEGKTSRPGEHCEQALEHMTL